MTLPRVDVVQRDTARLVTSARHRPPALGPLGDTHGELQDLAELEGATNGRLVAQRFGLPDLAPEELVYGVPNHTFINAAFTYVRPGGNRFNDERRGAWYAAFAVETALKEVEFHLTRALAEVNRFENSTDYVALLADFIGPFHDARGSADLECLGADAAVAYPAGQRLAAELRAAGSNGIVYPSARDPGGTCLVAFRPALVQNVRQGELWRLEWRGTPAATITRLTP